MKTRSSSSNAAVDTPTQTLQASGQTNRRTSARLRAKATRSSQVSESTDLSASARIPANARSRSKKQTPAKAPRRKEDRKAESVQSQSRTQESINEADEPVSQAPPQTLVAPFWRPNPSWPPYTIFSDINPTQNSPEYYTLIEKWLEKKEPVRAPTPEAHDLEDDKIYEEMLARYTNHSLMEQ